MLVQNRFSIVRIACVLIIGSVSVISAFAAEPSSSPAAGAPAGAPSGKRYAVLVGINDYADPSIVKLSTPRNDAADLGARLSADGWDKVFVLRDDVDYRNQDFPSRTNIENRVHLLADLVRPEDTIFLFFSGHGVSTASGSSLLPVDASMTRLAETGISLSSLVSVFTGKGLRKIVVAVDACREEVSTTKGLSIVGIGGTAGSAAKAGTAGKASASPAAGAPATGGSGAESAALTLFATKAGWYSYEDSGGRNGVFTRFILEGFSGKADTASDGLVTFSELAAWLPDATAAYALDKGIRQQAVAAPGSGDISVLEVPVARVKPGSAAAPAASAQGRTSADQKPALSAASSGDELQPLFSSIKGHVKTALVNSLKDIDASLAKTNESLDEDETQYSYSADYDFDIEEVDDETGEPVPASATVSTATRTADPAPAGELASSPVRESASAAPVESGGNNTAFMSFSLFQLSIFSPLQLFPERYVIGGLALGLIQTDNAEVYGVQYAPISAAGKMGGVQTGILCSADDMYGFQAGGLFNQAKNVYGAQFGAINLAGTVRGVQIGFLNMAKNLKGIQIGFLNVLSDPGLLGRVMIGLNIGF